MENLNDLNNNSKVEISALIGDALQSAKGIKYQIEQIHEALGDSQRFKYILEWLNMVTYGLDKMRNALDENIDWESMEGTDSQPER